MVQERWGRITRLLGVVVVVASGLGSITSAAAAGRASHRPLALGSPVFHDLLGASPWVTMRNPSRNLPPQPNFVNTCANNWRGAQCTAQALAAIDRARAREGVRRSVIVLPDNYQKLSVAEQTFVLTDLERTARGLKPFAALTQAFNDSARAAATARTDPSPGTTVLQRMGVHSYGSVWAGDFGPLASDYDWMYNDGYSSTGSINIACATPREWGCWGHRDNILGTYQNEPTLLAGAGTANPPGMSIAEVLTGGSGKATGVVYTWQEARQHGARSRLPRA